MNDRLALIGLVLLLVGLLALIVSGAVREVIVIPLLALLWLLGLLLDSVPQLIWWFGLLAIAALVAWRSLATPRVAPAAPRVVPIMPAPVASWAGMFERAAGDRYARWLLAQRLGHFALELLASQEQGETRGVWHYLQDESRDIPPAVRAFLLAGARMYRPLPTFWQRWWPWGARVETRADPLDLDLNEVVRFLDERLSGATGEPI
ncbi:MAG TPA: hypothetical protein VFO07_11350 [Roseiflexaceae bacterium]|nr:hypothetical protein [Roseiflexaceae bacterium]